MWTHQILTVSFLERTLLRTSGHWHGHSTQNRRQEDCTHKSLWILKSNFQSPFCVCVGGWVGQDWVVEREAIIFLWDLNNTNCVNINNWILLCKYLIAWNKEMSASWRSDDPRGYVFISSKFAILSSSPPPPSPLTQVNIFTGRLGI